MATANAIVGRPEDSLNRPNETIDPRDAFDLGAGLTTTHHDSSPADVGIPETVPSTLTIGVTLQRLSVLVRIGS
jgi:hypothetical protein